MPKDETGKHFSSKFRMNRSKRESMSSGEGSKPEEGIHDQAGAEDTDGESMDNVAKEHGPATEVHIKHDHEGGKHSLTTHHPDGHVHTSHHGSAEEAHAQGAKNAGVTVPGEGGESAMGGAEDSYEVPGLD
jgi:hypothetical protein